MTGDRTPSAASRARATIAAARALAFAWPLLIALLCASVLILAVGRDPISVYRLLLAGTWGSAYGFGQVLFKTTPLIFTGLAVAVGLRAGLFNIGVEGQVIVGAFLSAVVGMMLPPETSPVVAVASCLLGGAAGGAALGAFSGALKAWRGAHEVITTILMNFIVRAAMVGIGTRLFLHETIHTAPIVAAAELPRIGGVALKGSAVNASLVVALVVAGALAWMFARTPLGARLRLVKETPLAAETAGISVGATTILALAISGAVAGLAGTAFVLGYKHYYEDGFSGGVGFMGIAVAVLGGARPAGVVLAALAFGTLSQGQLAVNSVVPKEIVDVLAAIVILAVIGTGPRMREFLSRIKGAA
jgi:simple sugar transport system permease protein